MRDSIQGIGFVEPATEARRLVFKVNGVIARCLAEVGQAYKKGDVLMALDGREQLAAVAVADAEWKLAISERDKILIGVNPHQIEAAVQKVELLNEDVRYWQNEHERAKSLFTRRTISPSEYDKIFSEWNHARSALRQANADLRYLQHFVRDEDRAVANARAVAAAARLDLARRQLEDTILRAPFDGNVLEVIKRDGEGSRLLDPEAVAVFGDISRLRIRAEFDERFVARLRVGQKATVSGRGLGDATHTGRVVVIKPVMGKKTIFSRSATERKDLDIVQVMVEMDADFSAPIGLEVDVKLVNQEQ